MLFLRRNALQKVDGGPGLNTDGVRYTISARDSAFSCNPAPRAVSEILTLYKLLRKRIIKGPLSSYFENPDWLEVLSNLPCFLLQYTKTED
jgi:hypothetical protein